MNKAKAPWAANVLGAVNVPATSTVWEIANALGIANIEELLLSQKLLKFQKTVSFLLFFYY